MRPKFQADADLNQRIVTGLRRREPALDFFSARDGGIIDLLDPRVLQTVADAGRILVSHDRKTMPAHFVTFTSSQPSPGLIILNQDIDIGVAIEGLLLIWTATDAVEWVDRIGYLPL